MPSVHKFCAGLIAALVIAAIPASARAQMNTQHVKGGVGLKAGSQAPPGQYFIAPLLYLYSTDDIRDKNGDKFPLDASITASFFAGGVSIVTEKKFLGARYGFAVLIAGANNRIQATEIDANPGPGITDSVITPVSLGWHKKHADATAYYNLYLPTGRYENGAKNNTGLGMWGHEIGFGTTAYLTEDRKYHAATNVSFNFQSDKKDSDTHVGNQMNLEGGVGGDFLKGGLTAGIAYYYCFKLTEDHPGSFPLNIGLAKAHDFALGPDVTLALAKGNTVYGFLNVRLEWELNVAAQTKGNMFLMTLTFPFKPIHIPAP